MDQKKIGTVILDRSNTPEVRAVLSHCIAESLPYRHAGISELESLGHLFRAGAMPVGTPAFLKSALASVDLEYPTFNCYPTALHSYLHRGVRKTQISQIKEKSFIKPVEKEKFSAFVYDPNADGETTDPTLQSHIAAIAALSPATEVWASPPVEFASEWRYYVCDGYILGRARYGQTAQTNSPEPAFAATANALLTASKSVGKTFSMDVGVLNTGETTLINLNDAWSSELVRGALTPAQFFQFLQSRWLPTAEGIRCLTEVESV